MSPKMAPCLTSRCKRTSSMTRNERRMSSRWKCLRVGLKLVYRRQKLHTVGGLSKRIRKFGQDPSGRRHFTLKREGECCRARMSHILGIQQRQEVKGIRENSAHRFGVPWR